jgi:hypothetical protein
MGYLICKKCGGYYELQPGESPDDFGNCECGGEFIYSDTLDELDGDYNGTVETVGEDYNATVKKGDEDYNENFDEVNEDYEDVNNLKEDYEGSAYETNQEELLDEQEDFSQKRKRIVEQYRSDASAKSKRKDLKLATHVQERMNIDGFYKIKGKGAGNSLKILSEGIETGDGLLIKFQDIISIEDKSNINPDQKKSGINAIISPNYWLDSSRLTLKIRYDKGEIELKDVNKSQAKKFVSFVNRKLLK